MQSSSGGKNRRINEVHAVRPGKAKLQALTKQANQRSKEDWENTFNAISDWVAITDLQGRILRTNTIAEKFTGVAPSEIVGQSCCRLVHGSEKPIPGCPLQKMLHTRRRESAELQVAGSNRWLLVTVDPVVDNGGNLISVVHVARDITDRKKGEIREKLAHDTLALLNGSQDTTATIASILHLIKQSMGFEAIGVRLREGEDFPYYETKGFSEDFVLQERYLCARDDKGNIIRDIEGNALLECMCGNILSGRFDANLPFFTESGSFWTNSTTDLLASTTEKERQSRTRNRCNTAGYESVALIPLKAGSSVIGLLQINDRKRDSFTLDIIHFFEGLGASIGIAFSRKKAEEVLRVGEEKYRLLFENANDAIFLHEVSQEGPRKIFAANGAACRMLGYTREELLRMTIADIDVPEQTEKIPAILDRLFSEGNAVFETEHVRKDGSRVQVLVSIRTFDLHGTMVMLSIVRDITERKKAEESLQESKEFSENLIASMRDGFSVLDNNGLHIQVNPALCRMTGFSREELLGTGPPHPYWPQEEYQHIQSAFQRTLKGDFNDFELVFKRKNGERFPVIVSPSWIRDEEGNPKTYFATFKDITERKRAEQLLRKERDRAQKYLDVAGVMLIAIDSEQRVGLINKKGCEILGYKEEEILGKNWFNNFLPERAQREVQAVFRRLMSQQDATVPERYENPILTKSGEERLMAWHNSVLRDDAGRVIAALGSGEDITEQRKAEQKSLQYQSQLRSVASQLTVAEERERQRIATELHDQIGQSLTISKIRVDALHQSMKTGEHAKVLEEVCNCLSKAIGQVRSLTFDLSCPMLHQLGFEAAVAAWLTEQVEAKHHISTIFEDDEQAKPLDDDVRTILFRNVRELLINVVKHAKAHNVKVSVQKIGNEIQVTVEDDGIGFEPAESLAKAAREGKFGLFSIRERLEQLGGRLEIDSKATHGCRATMTAQLKKEGEINDGRI